MLQISYLKVIPYLFDVILDQYFDYEHIAHVHPTTLGEYVLLENTRQRIVYEQRWPADRFGRRAISRVVQTYRPPGDIWFEFVAGKHRGTRVHSELRPHPEGTEVTETYHLPWLPNWSILRRLIAPAVIRFVERVWEEDLRAGVCIGGWPGILNQPSRGGAETWRQPLKPGRYRVGPAAKFVPGSLTAVETPGGPVLIVRAPDRFLATHPTCPHTGGPLELGQLDDGCLTCPWHGARFDAAGGQALHGPTRMSLPVYAIRVEGDELVVEASG